MPRISVASIRTARSLPMPNNWMKLTELVPKAKKLTDRITAAIDTIRPLRANPVVTESVRVAPSSCSSSIRPTAPHLVVDVRRTEY